MKHGWNSWDGYFATHEKVLRFFSKYMVVPQVYSVLRPTDRFYQLICENILVTTYKGTRVRIDLSKDVLIEDQHGRLRARTYGYSYNANLPNPDGRNLIRYDSPHDDHNRFHHKHEFTTHPPQVIRIGDDDYPHVGEFFNEVLERF